LAQHRLKNPESRKRNKKLRPRQTQKYHKNEVRNVCIARRHSLSKMCIRVSMMLVAALSKNTLEAAALSPSIEWEKSYGGSRRGSAVSIQQTSDGGYIAGGSASSHNGAVLGNRGKVVGWLMKLDSKGNSVWRKTFGNGERGYIDFVAETADGGYIASGFSVLPMRIDLESSSSQCWILKLSKEGELIWQKTYGESGMNRALCIQQTADGSYIFSEMLNVLEEQRRLFYQVVKLDSNGDIVWQKSTGVSEGNEVSFVRQTSDGGYITAAGSRLGSRGDYDCRIVKLNSNGEIEWQKSFGGSKKEWAQSIQQTTDGGYIVAGGSNSDDGDVSGNHGGTDYWIVKLNPAGELVWQRSFGGSDDDEARSIQQTADGGYIVAGYSASDNGDVSDNHGLSDYWIIKLSSEGELIWQRALGSVLNDAAHSIQQTLDGGYIVAGEGKSSGGDISRCWIVKLVFNYVN
jgi:hypothetical protein